MKLRDHHLFANGKDRRARRKHNCDQVEFFGFKPHLDCPDVIQPGTVYFDTGSVLPYAPFKTYKLCASCAAMEYETANQMSPEDRKYFLKHRRKF